MDRSEFLTREEILTGLLARRANTLLFLVESRTAHLRAHSRQTMERFLTQEAARERDLAFLEAFSLGRQPPLRSTIQDLERHAPDWGALVPETPRMRAAVAHSLGQKYAFTRAAVPNIRAALGLDEAAVQEAYQHLYRQSLAAIFSPQVKLADRLRWASSGLGERLESLPPFWTASALALTETVGAGILALPIATAGIGPLAGVVLLIVFGLVNVLTVAYMAEAVLRSGTIRYGNAYIGRVVRDYLGNAGSVILSLGVFAICFLALWAYYIGFSTTMADVTRIPAEAWVVLLFLVGLYYVRRESLNATVASALLVGAINIGLIVILVVLALARMRPDYLFFVNIPFVNGRPFEPSILGLIFGVIVTAYFGHLSVSTCARAVIRRDPSGRSLMWGSMAAQAVAMVIYLIWVVAVNGAVDPASLAGESGTALIPLAREIGVTVKIVGSIFIILGMGMASIHFSLGLFNLTRERLPTRVQPVISLPRRQGRLVLQRRSQRLPSLYIAVTYLGLKDDGPHVRMDVQAEGHTDRLEVIVGDHWEINQLPHLAHGDDRLALDVVQASPQSICLRIDSSLSVSYEGEWETAGMSVADMLTLAGDQQKLIAWLVRQQTANLVQIATYLEQDQQSARELLALMIETGLVIETERNGETHYRVLLGAKRGRAATQEIWRRLGQPEQPIPPRDQPASQAGRPAALQRILDSALDERGRSLLSLGPIILVFLLAEWSLLADASSFSGLLSFLGVIVVSLLAGIFPVLLLMASRQKGEFVPGVVYRFLGHPLLLGGIYTLSLSSLFLHGLVIWDNPLQRAGALAVGLLMLGLTLALKRQGTFAPRMVAELRQDLQAGREAIFAVTAAGQPAQATVRLGYAEGEQQLHAATGPVPNFSLLRRVAFLLPGGLARELKVWVHKVTPGGDSESLAGRLEVNTGQATRQFDLKLSDEAVVLPLADTACQVDISLAGPGETPD